MIILDTNVVSELVRSRPDNGVVGWLDAIADDMIATTSITAAELLYGVARLPDGMRKRSLDDAVRTMLADDFADLVLGFDEAAANRFATIAAGRERLGRPMTTSDAQIAAICSVHGATLATRNTKDFGDTGIPLVNPWHTR